MWSLLILINVFRGLWEKLWSTFLGARWTLRGWLTSRLFFSFKWTSAVLSNSFYALVVVSIVRFSSACFAECWVIFAPCEKRRLEKKSTFYKIKFIKFGWCFQQFCFKNYWYPKFYISLCTYQTLLIPHFSNIFFIFLMLNFQFLIWHRMG